MKKNFESFLLDLQLSRPVVANRGIVIVVESEQERDWVIKVLNMFISTPDCFYPHEQEMLFHDMKSIYTIELHNVMSEDLPHVICASDNEDKGHKNIQQNLSQDKKIHVYINAEYAPYDQQINVERIIKEETRDIRLFVAIRNDFWSFDNKNRYFLHLVDRCFSYEVSSEGVSCERFINQLICHIKEDLLRLNQ